MRTRFFAKADQIWNKSGLRRAKKSSLSRISQINSSDTPVIVMSMYNNVPLL
jgi:hypothetical protein